MALHYYSSVQNIAYEAIIAVLGAVAWEYEQSAFGNLGSLVFLNSIYQKERVVHDLLLNLLFEFLPELLQTTPMKMDASQFNANAILRKLRIIEVSFALLYSS